jgi:hypothetical protein
MSRGVIIFAPPWLRSGSGKHFAAPAAAHARRVRLLHALWLVDFPASLSRAQFEATQPIASCQES